MKISAQTLKSTADTTDLIAIASGGSPYGMTLDTAVVGTLGATTSDVGIGTTSPSAKLDIEGDTIRLRNSKTPLSATDTCSQGEIVWDTDYIYVCVATNTWKRISISSW